VRLAWLRDLFDALFPRICAACGRSVRGERVLCDRCDAELPRIARSACARCQARPARAGGVRCGGCTNRGDALESLVAPVWFEGEVLHWIRDFKYPARGLAGFDARVQAAVHALGDEAARRAAGSPPDLVVPVPLHPRRLRQRGFNPAGLIARHLAVARRARFDPVALVRIRDTPSQTGLDAIARRRNLRGAVRAQRAFPPRVWVVDDVVTTGATLEECARALRAAGARQVVGLAAARTPKIEPG